MKKFGLKFIIALALLISATVILNFIYVHNSLYEENIKYKHMPHHFDVANTGSSHGSMSFDYSNYENAYNCVNLALRGQDVDYDYKILETYKDRIDENSFVFVVVTYITYFDNSICEDKSFNPADTIDQRYYGILKPAYINNYNLTFDICKNYLPILSAYDLVLDLTKDCITGDKYDGTRPSFEGNMQENADEFVDTAFATSVDENGVWYSSNKREQDLCDCIELIQSQGGTAVLIASPVTTEYTDGYKQTHPEALDDFYSRTNRVADKYGIPFYDYSNDARFLGDYSLFCDAHHLTSQGAKVFTDIVMDEVYMKKQEEIINEN